MSEITPTNSMRHASAADAPRPGTEIPTGALVGLRAAIEGSVVMAHDGTFDERRALWNGTIDKRPAAIVLCSTAKDVQVAVRFAVDRGIPLAVRGGGHNVAGYASVNDGIVIDLSQMRSVDVDPHRKRARVQGGATWADVDRATQAHGLAAPGGVVSDTGVGGLTLGGGIGWLRRKHGLSCDNLVAAELVTADGEIAHANAETNPDLLWALRGGGGNFGVVTMFEFELHPVGPEVMFAMVLYPQDRAAEVLRSYAAFCAGAPDEVSSFAILGTVPDEDAYPEPIHGEPYVLVGAMHAGDPEEARRTLQPLRELGPALLDASDVMPYVEVQQILDADYPQGRRYYWTSTYFAELSEEAIDALVAFAANRPSPLSTVDVWHLGGAIRRRTRNHSAFAQRSAEFLLGAEANWEGADSDEANARWARACRDALAGHEAAATYLNFPGLFEGGTDELRASFGDGFERLRRIKRRWDPRNVFWSTQNIAP